MASYAVAGMTCAACVKRVQGALSGLVNSAAVTLDPARAVLEGGKAADIGALNAALGEVGKYRLLAEGQAAAPAPAVPASWLATYRPLLVIIGFIALGSIAASYGHSGFDWHIAMNGFMGGFFLVFAGFKFLDLRGFADAYATYDLLARRWRPYGLIYPFIEAALGLAYLSGVFPMATLIATIVLMAFSSLGVIAALRDKRAIRCACLGTTLNLPMSTVTLVEDLGMVAMAAAMLPFVM